MKKVTVNFHGNLAQFGDTFTLCAETVNDAIRSLSMQIEGLKQFLRKGYYRVKVDSKIVTQSEYIGILDVSDGSVIHVSPRVAGAGKFGSFIVGAALIGASFIPGIGQTLGAGLFQMGVGLMLGGVAQMLTKAPNYNQDHKGIEDSKSSYFTNMQNIVGQGKQVPRVYGNLRVGSVVVSESVSSYRADGSDAIDTIQQPTYRKQRITLMPAVDPDGKAYNIDLNADSVKEAATTISVLWS